ncbi:MAG: hypothetical protein HYX77_03740 [Acidobacteria bacterium]|nr:hypothetical protein [Acidobacteriota bacterium]
MPLIKPRTRGKQFIRLISRLDRENNETLHAYAHFIGESAEYVLNQLLETVLAKDKEFIAWRAEHSESYVPLPRRDQKQAGKINRPRAASLTHAAAASGVAG